MRTRSKDNELVPITAADLARFRKNAPAALARRGSGFIAESVGSALALLLTGLIPIVGLMRFGWSASEMLVFLIVGLWIGIACDIVKFFVLPAQVKRSGDAYYEGPAIAPDGRSVACLRTAFGSPERAEQATIWLIDLASGVGRRIGADFDRWPASITWSPDGGALFVLADDHGTTAIFRLDPATDAVIRLTSEGSYADVCPTPDGRTLFAICSRLDRPPFETKLAVVVVFNDRSVNTISPVKQCQSSRQRHRHSERILMRRRHVHQTHIARQLVHHYSFVIDRHTAHRRAE